MASVNKVILVGNLGRDPEVRYTANGAAICNLTIATSRNWKDKNSGEKMEETEWHRVVLYDKLAEIAGQYLKKGVIAAVRELLLRLGKREEQPDVRLRTVAVEGDRHLVEAAHEEVDLRPQE